jgi:hypothetical protein
MAPEKWKSRKQTGKTVCARRKWRTCFPDECVGEVGS